MNFEITEEQAMIRTTIRDFAEKEAFNKRPSHYLRI